MEEKYKIIALFGKSGAGKDTIQKWLVKHLNNTYSIISCTTRPKREYEREGIDYHFVDIDYFKNADMLETAEFRGWYYGTAFDNLDKNKINIGVFNIQGIESLLQEERVDVLPIQITAPDKIRLIRSLNREENPDCKEICRRFQTDEEDFAQLFFKYNTYNNVDDDIGAIIQLGGIANFIGQ